MYGVAESLYQVAEPVESQFVREIKCSRFILSRDEAVKKRHEDERVLSTKDSDGKQSVFI